MRLFFILCLMLLLSGCASLTSTVTTIEDPQGQIWTIKSKSDALVEIKRPDGVTVKVDNRGKPTFFETYMQYLLITAAPTVELGNQPGTSGSD